MDDIEKLLSDVRDIYNKGIIKNRLSQFKINNFRKFQKESELNFTFPLTVIVGKNGSGKTTIMKAIKLLSRDRIPQEEFFETAIDDGGFKNVNILYILEGKKLNYKRLRENEWGKEGEIPQNYEVTYIQTKNMIGATDKSLLYDNIGKKPSKIQKVEYIIKQSKKITQNTSSKSQRKQRYFLGQKAIDNINFILQDDISSIEVINHKYFNGTWGISVIFNNNGQYSEYNSGSGEFVISRLVDQIQKVSSNSLLLIDEPEISLHPGAQKRLIRYILDVIKVKKIQVIITTHSTSLIEDLPKESIKCLRKFENGIEIEENVFFKNAFLELESNIMKKYIIVEDSLAKEIVQRILKEENMAEFFQIDFYPGGASNIKKHTLLTYSKTGINNRFILFDGDQKKGCIPDFSQILKINKTKKFFEDILKEVVNIEENKFEWGIDGNSKQGRTNSNQKLILMESYLNYYRDNVFFLPHQIPEDIIYDENFLNLSLDIENLQELAYAKNSKEKIKLFSEKSNVKISTIEDLLISRFIKRKNDDYRDILNIFKLINERRD